MTVVLSNINRNGQIRLELVDQSEKYLLQCSSSCCQLRELGMSKVQNTIRQPPGCRIDSGQLLSPYWRSWSLWFELPGFRNRVAGSKSGVCLLGDTPLMPLRCSLASEMSPTSKDLERRRHIPMSLAL